MQEKEDQFQFKPPLFKQRYEAVADVLRDSQVKTVADFGCAECSFVVRLKKMSQFEHIIGVDLDRDIVKRFSYRAKTNGYDFVFKRNTPLIVSLFVGDVCWWDEVLEGIEAVTMIELIEHLNSEELEQFPQAIFGIMQPKLVIITTPNVEFNVVFGKDSGFRHTDHKFEWTRKEFQTWCDNVSAVYGYDVEYSGVGEPPLTHPLVGHCSQIATFKHKENDMPARLSLPSRTRSYTLITKVHYPYEDVSIDKELYSIASAYITRLSYIIHDEMQLSESYDGTRDEIQVPLGKVMAHKKVEKLCDGIQHLRSVLVEYGDYIISSDENHVIISMHQYSSSSSLNDDNSNRDTISHDSQTNKPADHTNINDFVSVTACNNDDKHTAMCTAIYSDEENWD